MGSSTQKKSDAVASLCEPARAPLCSSAPRTGYITSAHYVANGHGVPYGRVIGLAPILLGIQKLHASLRAPYNKFQQCMSFHLYSSYGVLTAYKLYYCQGCRRASREVASSLRQCPRTQRSEGLARRAWYRGGLSRQRHSSNCSGSIRRPHSGVRAAQ
eukprot:UN3508